MKTVNALLPPTIALFLLGSVTTALSDDAEASKMVIAIASIETADSRADKAFKPVNFPKMGNSTLPHTEADILKCVDPDRREWMVRENEQERARQYGLKKEALLADYREAVNNQRELLARHRGTDVGRNILLSRDWLAVSLVEESGGCFDVIHRMDQDEAAYEQALQFDEEGYSNLASAYFVRLVFGDLSDKSMDVRVTSTFTTSQRILRLPTTIEVMDAKTSKLVFAKTIQAELKKNSNNVASESGNDDLISTVYRDGCARAAKEIANHFICDVIFKVVGPRDDDEFVPETASATLDGNSIPLDEAVKVLKGSHSVSIDMGEDYQLTGAKNGALKVVVAGNGQKVLKMESALCNLTIVVKGPPADATFDDSDATIELTPEDENGSPESLVSGNESRIRKGTYTLVVSKEGFAAKKQKIVLNKQKHNISIFMEKE